MKRSYMPWQCILASAIGLSACVDAGATIQVLRNQQPEDGCSVPASKASTFLPRGRIEATADAGYLFTPLVENVAVSSDQAARTVFVDGANIDLVFTGGHFSEAEIAALGDELTHFRQSFSGSIPAGTVASFAFEVISKDVLEALEAKLDDGDFEQVIAEVQIVGSIDGSTVKSNVFNYPIDVCKGCLVTDLGLCTDIGDQEINSGGVCQDQQDAPLDCCTKSNGDVICPAVLEEPIDVPPA